MAKLIPVTQIDWSDQSINRAGIVPIFIDKWLGLGVSMYSSNIGIIGGAFEEEKDHDLLATAVREYNEEIGSNFPAITIEKLYGCYAFSSNYSISIFLPINEKPTEFVSTTELHNIIWMTPHQLNIMAQNQEFILHDTNGNKGPGLNPKAFIFASDLKHSAHKIADIIKDESEFSTDAKFMFRRQKKTTPVQKNEIVTDVEKFDQDLKKKNYWIGSAVVIDKDTIGICHKNDGTLYLLPKSEVTRIVSLINVSGFKFLIGKDSDIYALVRNHRYLRRNSIMSVSEHANQSRVPDSVTDKYWKSLSTIRTEIGTERIVKESQLLIDTEREIYVETARRGLYFNQKRAIFLLGLNRVNSIIREGYTPTQAQIREQLNRSHKCADVSPDTVISVMLETGHLVF